MALLATLAVLAVPATAQPPAPVLPRNCGHTHPAADARAWLRRYVRSERPWLDETRVRHVRRCVASKARRTALRALTRQWRAWRQSYAHKWPIRFNRLPQAWQNWAYATGACEIGNNPATNTGNSFSGAFQFLPSTWWMAGGSGLPHQHSWHYQAWSPFTGACGAPESQWPNCAPW